MKLPKLEDWKAPWEVDLKEGDDPKEALDLDKLKRYTHGLLGDKERLQTNLETVTTERDTLKTEKDAKEREGETEVQRLTRERDEAIRKANEAPKTDPAALRLQVALDKGLTSLQAKRLVGTTQEELEADADELLKAWGPAATDDGEPDDSLLSKAPQRRPRTQGDPEHDKSSVNVEEAANAFVQGRSVLG